MTLGEKIRKYRMKKRMTQAELAKAVGSTVAAISRYELDQREPRYSLLVAMADVLDAPKEEFLEAYPKAPMKIDEYKERLLEIENRLHLAREEQNPSSQIKKIKSALSIFSQLLYEERFAVKDEERQSDKTILLETQKNSRQGRMLTAFNRLNQEAQEKAIERIKELGLIPAYQQITLPTVLKLYIYNQYKLLYSVINDTETQEEYTDETSSKERDWLINVRHIILQRRPTPNFRIRWYFLYYSCTETIGDNIIQKLIENTNVHEGIEDRIGFVFDDEATLENFRSYYESKCEEPYFCEDSMVPAQWTTLFILVEKQTWEIKEVIEFDPNTGESKRL